MNLISDAFFNDMVELKDRNKQLLKKRKHEDDQLLKKRKHEDEQIIHEEKRLKQNFLNYCLTFSNELNNNQNTQTVEENDVQSILDAQTDVGNDIEENDVQDILDIQTIVENISDRDRKKLSLANQLIQTLGFRSINDSETVILKENIENALQNLDPVLVSDLGNVYKNRVLERTNRGVKNCQELLCLVRRVLKRHSVTLLYEKRYKQRTAFFKYRLLYDR